jgi:sialate O-acetylesterase
VLQREADVKIWGWDKTQQKVTVNFAGSTYETFTNDSGKWEVPVSNLKAGGPYIMTIMGSASIIIRDVLIGDVWVCSGQSNMELNMNRASPLYGKEIETSENNFIRYFAAPQSYNFNKSLDNYSSGGWKKANPENVLNFGAVAYFFARELNLKFDVPIGIINTAIGGTPIEAWISEDAIKAFPEHYREAQRFKDKTLIDQIELENREKTQVWYTELGQKDRGYADPLNTWTEPDLKTEDWDRMEIPGYWAHTALGKVNGVVWFRKHFDVPSSMAGKPAKLFMGRIVDADSVFVNGVFTGTTSYQYPPRRYNIPQGVLREGKNTIVVRVISNSGMGGFVPDKPYELGTSDQKIDLTGDWYYRLGATMKPVGSLTTVKYKPTGLFNAMIAPLLNYRIKGVLWYQGESNAERPMEYRYLFPALINDWRSHWKQGDFPFLFVQLPNYMEASDVPKESNWALLRESQLKTLSLPKTAMAVAIDVGEWNDIHPLNKMDVAKRLVLAARKVAYRDEEVVYSGPIFESTEVKRNKVMLSFTHTGSGLTARGDSILNQFAIAGADRKFVWANAIIKKNHVIVWNNHINNPVAVRYAWGDNPAGANLYNKEGLPASPFRTDGW